MCWVSHKKPEYKIATEEIYVYKISTIDYTLSHQFKSHVKRHIYTNCEKEKRICLKTESVKLFPCLIPRLISPTEIILHSPDTFIIEKGYHSYGSNSDMRLCVDYTNTGKNTMGIAINGSDYFNFSDNMQVGVFIIPKGTRYAVNEEFEYVSSSIIFKCKFNISNLIANLKPYTKYLMSEIENLYHLSQICNIEKNSDVAE